VSDVPQSVIRLLIDEDLSPTVARRLRDEVGIDAVHLRDRGRLGEPDHRVLQFALAEGRILVTANVRDFDRLARTFELHAGIVLLLDGALLRDEQLLVVKQALRVIADELGNGHVMVNRVLNVSANGRALFWEP